MRAVAVRGGRLFEFQHVTTENKVLIYKDILDDWYDFGRQRLVLLLQVQQWHGQTRLRFGGFRML
jgi:hypothetical protein